MSAVSAATVLAGASLAATAGGTILSAAGQSQQAAQQAAAANYQAQIARMNQQAAERNAQLAQQQGEAQEDRQRLKTAQLMGSQRAAFAAQGGDVNAGSPLDILGDTGRAGETDALTISNNALQQAFNYRLQAAGYGGQANLHAAEAANTMANLPFGIGSSLLGGASSLIDKGLKYFPDKPNPGGSRYNLDADYQRTAGDWDLAGYN